MKKYYAILCLAGTIIPYWQFLSWIYENGPAFTRLPAEIMSSRLSAFAWSDVLISAVVLLGFILHDGNRIKMKRLWLPIVGTCTVGVSLGLPLYLLLREMHVSKPPISTR